jgi:hypothetical protein
MREDIFKKITRKIDLREYAPEMETEIETWVNPPRGKLDAFDSLSAGVREARELAKTDLEAAGELLNELGRKQQEWLREMWSQGAETTRWTSEEIERLAAHCMENDPSLWQWLIARTLGLITDYRAGQKKA